METKDKRTQFNWQTFLGLAVAALLVTVILAAVFGNFSAAEFQTLIKRLPYVLIGNQQGWSIKGGFAMNIIMSLACMAIATILGTFLGLAQIARQQVIRGIAWFLTQFFRNSPWLVILYVMLYLLPFQLNLGFTTIEFSPLAKSIIGLSLVVAANISEIVRGAIQSIPSGQWEASEAMGYTRWQILQLVILPQALRRMIPPWMNWYAILTMGTTLTNLVGVPEGLTAVREVLELEGEGLAIPLYTVLMLLFFIYCYPIARWTKELESRIANG
ncbi:MAG: amino acid ABC transporter permease [Symploca sp. SIO2C1]|nr:amino acid ABC transporter permease [Symploca sp. SIO2C1]